MKSALLAATAALAIGAGASAASATDITGAIYFDGDSTTHSTNYYDPNNGYVPAGYGNSSSATVTVGPGLEFGFEDGDNQDTADFSSSSLTIQDITFGNATNWEQTFTSSTAGYFSGLTLLSNDFDGLTFSVMGDTLTVDWGGTEDPGTHTVVFGLSSAAPEPGTWALMMAGVGLAGFALRRGREGTLATA